MDRTFILGVGAQKAGTSWLHRYLSSVEGADFGAKKEYHVWDARTVPVCRKFRVSPIGALRYPELRLRFAFQRAPQLYFRYFANILDREGVRLTGDITPSYSGLDRATYDRIHDAFEARGVAVKVVLLIRDPIERCWSSVRYSKKKNVSTEAVDVRHPEIDAVARYFRTESAQIRTRYDRTIEHLRASRIPDARVLVGAYEKIFHDRAANALDAFIGRPGSPALFGEKVNVTEKNEAIPDELAADIARFYRPVYEFCATECPEVKGFWRGFAFL